MIIIPDDSALLHGRTYDPVAARQYYLRTRHLKGRHGAVIQPVGTKPSPAPAPGPSRPAGGTHAAVRPSRQKELLASKAALTKRLETLKGVLDRLVAAAKARSGVPSEPDKTQTKTEQAKETAAKNEKSKKGKPLTAKQKNDKRAASKKQYDKENGTSTAQDVQQLHEQIKDIQGKITQALAEARKNAAKAQKKPSPPKSRIVAVQQPRHQITTVAKKFAPPKPQTALKGR